MSDSVAVHTSAKVKTVSETPGCEGCPMRKLFPDNTFVEMQRGSLNRLGIGEAPGESEAAEGKPFVGGSGTWLESIYRSAGVNKREVNLINCIQCRPPDNVYPTDPEARSYISKPDAEKATKQCWKNHVVPVLEERKWERIDLLGGKALEAATGRTEGIYKWRGSPMSIPDCGERLVAIPTLHPAAIARDQTMLPVAANDLRKGLTPPPEKYNLHPTLQDVQAFEPKELCLDIEVTNWWLGKPKITMVGVSDRLYTAMVIPFIQPYIKELRRIVLGAATLIGHNIIQYDIPLLFKELDIEWSG